MKAKTDGTTAGNPKRSWLRRVLDWTAGVMVAGLALWAVLFFVFAPELPDTEELLRDRPSPGLTVFGANGEKIIHRGSYNGLSIRLARLPAHLPEAVIATEDRRFYDHFGMDVVGFFRALVANVKAGGVVQGGSTLTQQLAKNLYLSHEQTLLRKIRELMLAIWLETRLTKDQILELYLNRVYLGAGAYGVEAAAQRYFGKSAALVNLQEAAMLAGLLKAPSAYAPTRNLDRAQRRAAQVLVNMVAAGFLSQPDAEAAAAAPATLARQGGTASSNYFVDWIVEKLDARASLADRDLEVRTTLDPALQEAADRVLREALDREGKALGVDQAALVALAPDGAVMAMVGGRSYRASQFNRAAMARRQPGSAFKPVVFLAALEAGLTPDSRLEDKPVRIGDWTPRNWTGKYQGQVTLRDALARSINSVAVQVQERAGRGRVIETARRLGIASPLKPEPSLALGTYEVTPLELTAAYATFAGWGSAVRPYGVVSVEDRAGRRLYGRQSGPAEQVVGSRRLSEMRDMLAAVVHDGTGRAAKPARGGGMGKTGTTQAARDGWFVGISDGLTVGVWVGNDDGSATRGLTGGGLPARIWKALIDWRESQAGTVAALPVPAGKPARDYEAPGDPGDDVVQRLVDWVFDDLFGGDSEDAVIDRETAKDVTGDVIDWMREELRKQGAESTDSGRSADEDRRGR